MTKGLMTKRTRLRTNTPALIRKFAKKAVARSNIQKDENDPSMCRLKARPHFPMGRRNAAQSTLDGTPRSSPQILFKLWMRNFVELVALILLTLPNLTLPGLTSSQTLETCQHLHRTIQLNDARGSTFKSNADNRIAKRRRSLPEQHPSNIPRSGRRLLNCRKDTRKN